MKVNIMEVRKGPETENHTQLMMVDEETLITVKGIGTAGATWKVENAGGFNPSYNPDEALQDAFGVMPADGWKATDTFGPGAVWMEPLTFAHAVMNCINNQ